MFAPRVLLWCLLVGLPLSQVMAQSPRLKPLRNHKLRMLDREAPAITQQATQPVVITAREKPAMLMPRRNKNRTGPRIQRPQRHEPKVWYRYLKQDRAGEAPLKPSIQQNAQTRPPEEGMPQ